MKKEKTVTVRLKYRCETCGRRADISILPELDCVQRETAARQDHDVMGKSCASWKPRYEASYESADR